MATHTRGPSNSYLEGPRSCADTLSTRFVRPRAGATPTRARPGGEPHTARSAEQRRVLLLRGGVLLAGLFQGAGDQVERLAHPSLRPAPLLGDRVEAAGR